MRPYIIKKTDRFLSDFILASYFYLFFSFWGLFVDGNEILIFLSVLYFAYVVYIMCKIIAFKKKEHNFEVLVVDEHGIKCEDEIGTFKAIWEDISEIRFYKTGPAKNAWTEMSIICNDDDKYKFSFRPYTYAMNLYRLRKCIMSFSKREDIFIANFHLWLQW